VLLSLVKGEIRFSDPEFHKRETTLYASRNAVEADFRHVMDTMRAGLVPVDLLATHETSLEDAVRDMPRWVENRGALVKAIIHV
jgi:threonine dehydrogenase-like Zn-dependent dehydrogenase